jgi:hypothetical protein
MKPVYNSVRSSKREVKQWQFQFSDKWIIVAAEAHKQDNELGLETQELTQCAYSEIECYY